MRAAFLVALLAFATTSFAAEELIVTNAATSPDGRKRIEAKTWLVDGRDTRIDILLTQEGEKLYAASIPPEREVRYAKVAWSPGSDAALVGLNQKASEDLLLLRLAEGKATATTFDGGELVLAKLLDTLPFRDEIKSSAPVARIPWKMLKWPKPGQCRFLFIHSGIGYRGTARLLLDYRANPPQLTIEAIEPKVADGLFEQE